MTMEDNDPSEYWRGWRSAKQARHDDWHKENCAVIKASGVAIHGETWTSLIFRHADKPMVDFYPHTGRWRVVDKGRSRTYSGGAKAFLAWFAKQRK